MKKVLSLLLIVALVFTLAGCGKSTYTPTDTSTPDSVSSENTSSETLSENNSSTNLAVFIPKICEILERNVEFCRKMNLSPFTYEIFD